MGKDSNPGFWLTLLALITEVFILAAKIMFVTVILLNIVVWLIVSLKFGFHLVHHL